MDWIRTNIAAAKSGDTLARIRLGIPVLVFAVVVYLQFGSISKPAEVVRRTKTEVVQVQTNLFVHVVGEVKNPGVYALDSGSRMYDLIASAGGFTKRADQSSVNLARTLNDGEQVKVYSVGALEAEPSSNLISINRSSVSDLEQLPGVGPKLAARIVDWREANGGFSSLEQLRKVGGIGDKLFAGIKDQVTL